MTKENKQIIINKYLGKKIRIIDMIDERDQVRDYYRGRMGVVESVDDIGQLHGTWGGLAVIPDQDDFEIIGG